MARVDTRQVAAALPSYEIGGELGRGGFGTVLAARHKLIGRDVAVKVLLDSTSADDDVRARFLAEARVLAGLDHPHVVRIFDYVEHDGLCLLVMEQLTGGSLRRRAGLSPLGACAIGLAGAAALTAAHDSGVLHRDMKPDNMMFSAEGLTKVTDFGIAKILETTAATTTGMVGTPRYMAPEQIAGTRLGPATDLYALAVVLYELLASRPPFHRDLPVAALLHHHLSVPPQPLPEAPPAVAEILYACLSKDPAARPPSARAFAVGLAQAGTISFGPDWLSRSGVPVRLDDEVLAAAGHLSSATPPPAARYGLPPTAGAPWPSGGYPPTAGYPTGGYPTTAGPYPATRGHEPTNGPGPTGDYPMPGGHPARVVTPTRRDRNAGPGGRRRAAVPGGGGGRRIALVAGVTAVCLLGLGIGVPFALGVFDDAGDGRVPAAPSYDGPPLTADLQRTDGVTIGGDGTVYVADYGDGSYDGQVFAISPDGAVTTVAGTAPPADDGGPTPSATPTTFGDGGPATSAVLRNPGALAVGADGSVYVAEYYGEQVRRIDPDGTVSAFAGASGTGGFDGTSGEATGIDLSYPTALAVGPDGTVYVARGGDVLEVTANGRIAPLFVPSDEGDFELAPATPEPSASGAAVTPSATVTASTGPRLASLYSTTALAVDEAGSVYVADKSLNVIVKIDPDTGEARRFAGTGDEGDGGDGGPATQASLSTPSGLAFGPDGALYVTDQGNGAIRRIDRDGTITTWAGGGEDTDGDGSDAKAVALAYPTGIAVDSTGAVYYSTYFNSTVRRIGTDGILHTVLAASD